MESSRVGEGGGCGAPAGQLSELLARAQNGFEIDEPMLERLGTALMHQAELRSYRQRNELPRPLRCNTYRHIFLLADGSSLLLYELEHDAGPDEWYLYEVYAEEAALDRAERRVHEWIGGS
ncbi:DUF6227 family protein, partial [Streptomyces sp. NPDC057654]|uniref:DUF6227 family protein n=1 Tax=Streptomyces sp. NPDC057654 TaxID=3346196 RepID=UPI0036AAAA86